MTNLKGIGRGARQMVKFPGTFSKKSRKKRARANGQPESSRNGYSSAEDATDFYSDLEEVGAGLPWHEALCCLAKHIQCVTLKPRQFNVCVAASAAGNLCMISYAISLCATFLSLLKESSSSARASPVAKAPPPGAGSVEYGQSDLCEGASGGGKHVQA